MKPRICFINRLFSSPGGRCTFINNLSEGLAKKYDCFIISGNNSKLIYSFGLIVFFLQSFFRVLRIKPQYVIGVGLSSIGGLIAAFIRQTPIVYNLSGPNVNSLRQTSFSFRKLFGMFFTRFIEKTALLLATVIAVPSYTSYDLLKKEYGERIASKIKIIPEGITSKKSNLKKYPDHILFPWMTERKNLSFFLDNLPSILNKTSFRVIFMGFPEMIPKDYSEKLVPFKNRIEYTGFMNKKQALPLADLLVYIPRTEAHSYTVLEAARQGMPILISRVDWLEEEFPDYPLQLREFTGAELERAILYFLKHKKEIYSKIEKSFLRVLKKYDYAKMVREYYKLIDSIKQD